MKLIHAGDCLKRAQAMRSVNSRELASFAEGKVSLDDVPLADLFHLVIKIIKFLWRSLD